MGEHMCENRIEEAVLPEEITEKQTSDTIEQEASENEQRRKPIE